MTGTKPACSPSDATPEPGDALVIIDVQRDFLPGGALAVQHGDEVIDPLNRYIALFVAAQLPIFATRDWHPTNHCSFEGQGGRWPPHGVANTAGAEFSPLLRLPQNAEIVSKATEPDRDSYSAFGEPSFECRLHELAIKRLWIGGLATDYCVLSTVRDAIREGWQVLLLIDAIRAVNLHPNDGERAVEEMLHLGAKQNTLP